MKGVLLGFEDSDASKCETVYVIVFIAIVQKVRQGFSVSAEAFVQTVLC